MVEVARSRLFRSVTMTAPAIDAVGFAAVALMPAGAPQAGALTEPAGCGIKPTLPSYKGHQRLRQRCVGNGGPEGVGI